MENYDDFGTYNGDTEHDMWVDFDNYENTGTPDVFFAGAKRQVGYDESDLDNFIDNLNDWD